MAEAVTWLEAHEGLSGWAQFAGAMLALAVTYLTAFAPIWHRKRQLRKAAARLLLNSYEVLESYHRTTPFFFPTSLSLRGGALAVGGIVDEISRFPIYELDDQGSRSLARNLVAASAILLAVRLVFEDLATTVSRAEPTEGERDALVGFLAQQMENVRKILSGEEMKRPEWAEFYQHSQR